LASNAAVLEGPRQVVSGRADYRNFRTFSVDVNTIIK